MIATATGNDCEDWCFRPDKPLTLLPGSKCSDNALLKMQLFWLARPGMRRRKKTFNLMTMLAK